MSDGLLEALAARFVIPHKSGVYLSRNELIALARASDASLRVNERRRMLVDVLKSPQTPAQFRELLERLQAFCRARIEEHEDLAKNYPVMAGLSKEWVDRARATIQALSDAAEEISFAERAGDA
ncbi:MAG: hypothetical protein U0228_02130 [Myxococcaceae bacterium]